MDKKQIAGGDKVFNEAMERMVNMEIDDEFIFYIRDKEDSGVEFPICVKVIEEFQSIMIITGALGMGGFNMIFPFDDNMVDRDNVVKKMIIEEFSKEFAGFEFVKFYN